MARRSLVANARRQQGMVQQEFTVNDSILAVSVLQVWRGWPRVWEVVCTLVVALIETLVHYM